MRIKTLRNEDRGSHDRDTERAVLHVYVRHGPLPVKSQQTRACSGTLADTMIIIHQLHY